ncbi:MAG TPA: large conductance mechanosensitive channel protein MscL, partial [Cytophagales bacterium]|nr:large conductance mechanosensitive channel protein MscL [Cytophagales bacterium]
AFIMRGNVLDLAVAVIIGAAFGAIVTSFTNDILLPPIGLLLGNVDFPGLKIVLQEAGVAADGTVIEEVAIKWGAFVKFILDFLIVGFVLFILIKASNALKKKEEPAAPAGPTAEQLLTEIRDLLKK